MVVTATNSDLPSNAGPSFDLDAVLGIRRRAAACTSSHVKVVHKVVCVADVIEFAAANRGHAPAVKHVTGLACVALMKAPILPNHVTAPGASKRGLTKASANR